MKLVSEKVPETWLDQSLTQIYSDQVALQFLGPQIKDFLFDFLGETNEVNYTNDSKTPDRHC